MSDLLLQMPSASGPVPGVGEAEQLEERAGVHLLFRGEERALAQVEDDVRLRVGEGGDQLPHVLPEGVRPGFVAFGPEGAGHRAGVDLEIHLLPDLLLDVLDRLEHGGVEDGDAKRLRRGCAHAAAIPSRTRAWERISSTRERYGSPIRSAMIGRSPYPGERPGQRVALDELRRSLPVEPEIDAGEVAAPEGPVDPQRAPLDPRQDRPGQRRRARGRTPGFPSPA